MYLRVPPCQALRSRKITPPALRPITVESFLSTQSRAICQRRSRNPEPAGCLGTYEYSGPWYHVVLLCCCLLFFFVFVLTSSRALRGGPAVSRGSCACLGSGGSLRAHARERLSDGRRETGRQGDRETERQRDRETHRQRDTQREQAVQLSEQQLGVAALLYSRPTSFVKSTIGKFSVTANGCSATTSNLSQNASTSQPAVDCV